MDNYVFKKIAKDLEQILLDLEDRLIAFNIGKTGNSNNREYDYQNKGYTHFCEICYGTPELINQGEKYLIAYFSEHASLKEKMANERGGGGGASDADLLYIAIRNRESNIDDIDGNILPQGYPINLK